MAIYAVTYDLRAPGKDYRPVHDYLGKLVHCKNLESFWLVDSTFTAVQIRDTLAALVDSNDQIFVARLQREWASWSYGCSEWLSEPARRW